MSEDITDTQILERHQAIQTEIGRIMRDVAPPDAAVMVFLGKIYPTHGQRHLFWLRDDGSEGRYTRQNPSPKPQSLKIGELMRELRELPPYEREPFTHYRIELTHQMKFSIDFAYVPESQDYLNVFMRPVSALSPEEAAALRVPEDEYEKRRRLAGEPDAP